jgi:hypothetical protein
MSQGAIQRLGGMRWRDQMTFMPEPIPIDLALFLPAAAPFERDFAEGRLDPSFTPYIYAARDRRLADGGAAMMIGSAGVDGIEFALRRGQSGIWAFFPYLVEWKRVAEDVVSFEADWLASRIKL